MSSAESKVTEAFDMYERRFARAVADRSARDPIGDRAALRCLLKQCLGIRDEWMPEISAEPVRVTEHDGFRIEHLRGTSWPGVAVSAYLYIPDDADLRDNPFILQCCGHGSGGKQNPGYQLMARHLARHGACVLVPDNIGQGEREWMGHREPVAPFYCGTSVQGLVVMEALGWLAWARTNERFDNIRMGAAGNSGGGHLTRNLAALDDRLAALSSSGQASTIAYTAQKERRLCHCALVPGIVNAMEMWQQYGCFAPRPLFLFNGREDHLFPWDLFRQTARKVRAVYVAAGAEAAFRESTPSGGHSWDASRRALLADFFVDALSLPRTAALRDAADEDLLDEATGSCFQGPPDGITTDELARVLTGVEVPSGLKLRDVFPPEVEIPGDVAGHDEIEQVFAQFEAFLKPIDDQNR